MEAIRRLHLRVSYPPRFALTGGAQVESSNITLVFGAPASGHFGSQPINGAVRDRK